MPGDDFLSGGLRQTFRALRHRNYRLFFFGQGVSLIGTWMQHTALQWLIYELTGKKLLLGVVAFAGQLPMFFLTPLAGVMADRWNHRRVLMTTQMLSMAHALMLAVLVLGGVIRSPAEGWLIVALSAFLGMVNAFDMPVRQSFVVHLVGSRADLGNAIALNSFLMNGSRLVGPSIAGLIIALVARWTGGLGVRFSGEGACFLLNAGSYLAVIAALRAIRLAPGEPRAQRRHVLHELAEGAVYAWRTPGIRTILLLVAALSLVGAPALMTLLPVFAKDILGGGPQVYGLLLGAVGVGAVIGTVFLAWQKSPLALGRTMALAAALLSAALLAFAFSTRLWLSAPILIVAGLGLSALVTSGNTLLQTLVDDDKRGRVMGLHGLAFLGMMPFGSLLAGWAAEHIGAPNTVLISGLACLAGALLFAAGLPVLRRSLATARLSAPTAAPPDTR